MATIDRGDCRLWWNELGDPAGEPVLLVMGLGYPSDMWFRWLPEVTARYRVLVFDNRGTGRTGVPPGPYTIEGMAADARAVLDAAGVEHAHVVGASMGGMIAQELTLGSPERVRSLVLACTGPGGSAHVQPEAAALEMAAARAGLGPDEAAELAVPFVYAPHTPRERIDEDLAVRAAHPTDSAGYAHQLGAIITFAGTADRLPTLQVPTLVLHGLEDRLIVPANAELLARSIPGAELALLEDASHILMTDQPRRSTDVVLDFLAAHAGSGSACMRRPEMSVLHAWGNLTS